MKLKKYKLGELIEVTRGQSLSGEYYSTNGKLMSRASWYNCAA